MIEKTPLLVVCGPTASGKTRLAVSLALEFNGEIVSADSMQIYKSMDIGTAKPTEEEKQGVPHHLVDFLEPDRQFSVARYAALARQAIAGIGARGRLPVLAGGTGLYIRAVTDNVQFFDMGDNPVLREELRAQAAQEGNGAVWALLRKCDPALAGSLHPNNLGRVIRGIEVFRATGTPLSVWQQRALEQPAPYHLLMLGIAFADREQLYQRIDFRVEQMLEQGLLEEAREMLQRFSGTASQAIGYKELEPYFEGNLSLDEAVDNLKRETRRYAKRQMTWLRRDERIRWLYADHCNSYEELLEKARGIVADSGIVVDG